MKALTKKTDALGSNATQEPQLPTDAAVSIGPEGAARALLELVGQRLRDARARRFMTRKTLAEDSGISLAYLARVENGTGNISLGLLHRLALTLNLPIASFLSPEEPPGAKRYTDHWTAVQRLSPMRTPTKRCGVERELVHSRRWGPAAGGKSH